MISRTGTQQDRINTLELRLIRGVLLLRDWPQERSAESIERIGRGSAKKVEFAPLSTRQKTSPIAVGIEFLT